ncbi:MAG TPA: lytic transglycosylase domain-containing protein, partial [Anaeromyxobacteraceae bacterium]
MRPSGGRVDEPLATRLESLAAAAESQARGEYAAASSAARIALGSPSPERESAQANLALGAARAGEGRLAEAAATLLAAEPALAAPLRQGARLRLGEALFYGGRAGAAAQAFAAAAAGEGPLAERARWREADALLAAGLPRPAARAYQALLARSPRHPAAPGARLSLAAALRALGEDARAVSLYREVALDRVADPEGAAAEEALAAWRAAGGPIPEATAADHLARAERFLQVGRPRRVLEG